MTIQVDFSDHKSLRGQRYLLRRTRLTELLTEIPAEIIDREGKPVTMTIDRVDRNIYWVHVKIPGYAEGQSKINIQNPENVELRDDEFMYRMIYTKFERDSKKHAMKTRMYCFLWDRNARDIS